MTKNFNPIYIQYYKSPVGDLIIGSCEDQLCLCDWRHRKQRENIDQRLKQDLQGDFLEQSTGVIEKTITQLTEYFQQKRRHFDIPLLLIGTEFQKQIWQWLLKIPYGKTETYGALARRVHNPQATRAVAAAVGANPLAIIVPCHRIIGTDGNLVGYAGGLPAKQKMLELEDRRQLSLF